MYSKPYIEYAGELSMDWQYQCSGYGLLDKISFQKLLTRTLNKTQEIPPYRNHIAVGISKVIELRA